MYIALARGDTYTALLIHLEIGERGHRRRKPLLAAEDQYYDYGFQGGISSVSRNCEAGTCSKVVD